MATLVWLPVVVPALVAAWAAVGRRRRWTLVADLVVAVLVLGCGVGLVVAVQLSGAVTAAGGLLRADALAAFLLTVIGSVAVTALWGGLPLRASRVTPDGRYAGLVAVFLAAMSLAVLADNLGVVWVAVEATTIATAFLVGHHGGRAALEAAWKYVVLGSVGVAIAFLGIVLLYAAARAAGNPTLSWVELVTLGPSLDPDLARIGVALAALGFATKAGLAPMHSWLPDAHSQAPAPVSALMSGVLLSVAFSAILRVQAVSDASLGPAFMRGMLVAGGLLSLATAAALMLAQRDYKRLLAYSSIEHMGILALGAAVGGPVATAAVLLHVLGHGLAKAVMFLVAGRILDGTGSSRVADVQALLASRPDLARPFLAGVAALLGFPPFVLFFTEVAIVVDGWSRGLGWAMAVALALLLVVFVGFGRQALSMTTGPRTEARTGPLGSASAGRQLPLALALAVTAVLGFVVWPVAPVLDAAVASLAGSP
jgi:hydrogenase-4 component F